MDQNTKQIYALKVKRTIENLKKNNMQGIYIERKEELFGLLDSLLSEGNTINVGGSMTLFETGVIDYLRSGKYDFQDRYAPGLTPEGVREVFIKAFSADAYICSTNALTEDGELYNVDGNSNRVAAMVYGPKSVIVIVGYNKLVKDLDEAKKRVESISAPANATRLNCKTPCTFTGECGHCKSEGRICCNYVVMAYQRHKDRIKVIIVGESLGY